MRRSTEYSKIISTLNELHKTHPTYNLARHIATALDGYRDLWSMSDKEFLFSSFTFGFLVSQ